MLEWKTGRRKINDLIPYEHNPRQMTEKQAKDLEASLRKFNLAEIPAINKDNTILAGHQRLKIMQLLGRGEEETDVRIPSRKLSEKEVQEYNIRSNKNTGEWDFDILANAFDVGDLKEWGFDEKFLGANSSDFDTDSEVAYGDGDEKEKRTISFFGKDKPAILSELERMKRKYEGLAIG